jgi:hypothetical protein
MVNPTMILRPVILLGLTSEYDRNLLASLADPTADEIFTNPFLKILTVNFFLLEDFLKMTKCYSALTRPPAHNPASLGLDAPWHELSVHSFLRF